MAHDRTTGPRLIPEEPVFATGSEEETWENLRSALPAEAVLLANQRISDDTKDHEADLVVLMPDVGVVVVEVKGGSVWRRRRRLAPEAGARPEPANDPVAQARQQVRRA